MQTSRTNRSPRMAAIGAAMVAAALLIGGEASAQLTPEWVTRRAGVDGFFLAFQAPAYVVTDNQGAVYVSNSTLRVLKTDIETVKYAPDGTEVWSVTYDGPSQHADRGKGITIDSAGDILVLGQSESLFLVIKYDASDGSIIGTMQHDPGGIDRPNALTTDDAGNIYVTGSSWPSGTANQDDFYTLKMDSMGNVLWTARYNGPGPFLFAHDVPVDIALDSNGDVFVTGPSNSANASPDYATIKYRGSDGTQLWLDRYHRSSDTPVDLIVDSQDNVYVTGSTEGQSHVITTIKYRNADGARLWVAVDAPATQNYATSLALDSQGDVYVAGRADPDLNESNGNDNAVVIRHRASDGARLWTTQYGENVVGHFDNALDIIIDASDNVYISGQTSSFGASADLLILRYDAGTGQIVDQGTYDIPGRLDKGQALALDSDQNVIVAGTTRGNTGGFFDFLTLRYPARAGLPATLTDVTRTLGIHISGGVPELLDSDGTYYVLQSGPGFDPSEPHPARADFTFDSGGFAANTLDITLEEKANIGGPTAVVLLHNWTTGDWDELNRFTLSPSDQTFMIRGIPASDYINTANRIEVRARSFAVLILNPTVRAVFSHDFISVGMVE